VVASPSPETMDESRQERLFAENRGRISPPEPGLHLGTSGWSYAVWEGTLYMTRNTIIRELREEVPLRPYTYERPHGCYDVWVCVGFEGEDESG
jgi:hypothetical protein